MSTTLLLFYVVFLSQIFLVSIYFPMKIRKRALYVLNNYPLAKYPKLYPKPYDYSSEKAGKKGLRTYRNINLFIAGIGLGILVWAATSGHSFSPLGGDEIFVLLYFVLQMTPFFYLEITGLKQYKRMREADVGGFRKAELNPRNLFDFISPVFVALAVLLYAGWMISYLYGIGFDAPWEGEVYAALAAVTGSNLFMAGLIAKFMLGKKIDPHQAYKDRLKRIETIVKACVFTSIAASVFLIITDLVDRFELELYDPVLMSIYLQLIIGVNLGLEFRKLKVETLDFSVYKEDVSVK